jgi:hypothetical protein
VTALLYLIGGPADGRTVRRDGPPDAWVVEQPTPMNWMVPGEDEDEERRGLYYPISDLSRRGYDVPPLRSREDEWLFLWGGWVS